MGFLWVALAHPEASWTVSISAATTRSIAAYAQVAKIESDRQVRRREFKSQFKSHGMNSSHGMNFTTVAVTGHLTFPSFAADSFHL